MKRWIEYKATLQICGLFCFCIPLMGLAQGDSSKKEARQSIIYLQFRVKNNQVPYLNVQTKNKIGKRFQAQGKVPVKIYLDKDSDTAFYVGLATTNIKGETSIWLPGTFASKWNGTSSHTFFAHTDSSKDFDATTEELTVALARLEIDTVKDAETRTIEAHLVKKEGNSEVPMPGVDIKLAVKRFGGNLNIGEDETYTTDSTGKVTAEFQKLDLPGDTLGNLELVAIVEDNDEVGSLETGLKVPWGVRTQYTNEFFGKRSLYATGNRAPLWLLVMAYGCIIGVWSVIIYLITRIVKIKKLGVQAGS